MKYKEGDELLFAGLSGRKIYTVIGTVKCIAESGEVLVSWPEGVKTYDAEWLDCFTIKINETFSKI